MLKKYASIFTWAFWVFPGILFSQDIQINFPDVAKKTGIYAYLAKPYGLKLDTVAKCEFINGSGILKSKDFPKGLYQFSVTGMEKPGFLLLGNSSTSMKYVLGENSRHAPIFQNSEVNTLLQDILTHNDQYHAERNMLGQAAQALYEFDTRFKTKTDSVKFAYDKLHEMHNQILDEFAGKTSDEYLKKVLIPVLKFSLFTNDADKARYDNERAFQHYEFFRHVDFSAKQLAGDHFYARKLNEYITYFGGRSTGAKQESCSLLVNATKASPEVQRFTVETLMEIYFSTKDYEMVEFISNLVNTSSCEAPRLTGDLKTYVEQSAVLQPGKTAPDISLKDPTGKFQVLSLTAQSHQKTLVFFWASWCPHCLDLVSKLKPVYPELKAKGIEIFAIALDDNFEDWVRTVGEYEIPWINVSERKKWETQAVLDYNVRSTPTIFLLSGKMTIAGKYHAFEDIMTALQSR